MFTSNSEKTKDRQLQLTCRGRRPDAKPSTGPACSAQSSEGPVPVPCPHVSPELPGEPGRQLHCWLMPLGTCSSAFLLTWEQAGICFPNHTFLEGIFWNPFHSFTFLCFIFTFPTVLSGTADPRLA